MIATDRSGQRLMNASQRVVQPVRRVKRGKMSVVIHIGDSGEFPPLVGPLMLPLPYRSVNGTMYVGL